MAEVIPLDGDRPRRRRTPGDALAAGAERAGGERARRQRRTTPLLAGLDPAASTGAGSKGAGSNGTGSNGAVPEGVTDEVSARAERRQAVLGGTTAPAKKSATRPAPTPAKAAKPVKPAKAAKPVTPAKAADPVDPVDRVEPVEPAGKPRRTGPPPAPTRRKGPPPPPPRRAGPPPPPPRRAKPVEPGDPDRPFEPPAAAASGWAAATDAIPGLDGLDGLGNLLGDGDRLAELVGTAAQVGGWIAEILVSNLAPALAEQKLAGVLEFLTKRLTGDYQVDEFGFDPELTDKVLLAMARPLYQKWFRVEVRGIENIPSTGGALVVANHSGAVAIDSLMTAVAVHDEHPDHRFLRMLGADLVFSTPVISQLARKGGATLASNPDAERLLSGGEVVGVWPEGFKGIGKPFSERYKLQRFGRGGFVSAALRTRTPIIPCSIVGAEEIYPIIGNLPTLARLLGLPYLPITPTFPWLGPLGAIPLPSKWLIEFGEPVPTDQLGEGAQDDPMLIFDLTDQVRQTIQQTLYTLLMQRRSIFY